MSITIYRYNAEHKHEWDNHVSLSKNAHFMFYRDYLEYHGDRFTDFSLLFFNRNSKLLAVLPAAKVEGELISHPGVTFGGILIRENLKYAVYEKIFATLCEFVRKDPSVNSITIKPIPYIYHSFPADEILYSFYQEKFEFIQVDLCSVINLNKMPRFQQRRTRGLKKANKHAMELLCSDNLKEYWCLLTSTLFARHGVRPVHSLSEIKLLMEFFPNNIKCFTAIHEGICKAGVIMFETENVCHSQYIAASEEGRQIGALDWLFNKLIENYKKEKKYFSFGSSMENNRNCVNHGLLAQKEGFGALSVAHLKFKRDF